ncbi:MAG: hypothetical protein JST06_08830, partial [Bacteroidetes bacterium]|nr:hypothetical protein [Bacteroidota bacterium]
SALTTTSLPTFADQPEVIGDSIPEAGMIVCAEAETLAREHPAIIAQTAATRNRLSRVCVCVCVVCVDRRRLFSLPGRWAQRRERIVSKIHAQ